VKKKKEKKPTVELLPAFVWCCEDCGRDTFCRALVVEMEPDKRRELLAHNDISEMEGGEFVAVPESVTCPHCGSTFETEVV
jgi:hypothetical protein